ncbi:MAG: hypothetical protein ACRCYT_06075 [Cetobacterium sp.]
MNIDKNKLDRIDKIIVTLLSLYYLFLFYFIGIWFYENAFEDSNSIILLKKIILIIFYSGIIGGAFYGMRALYRNLGHLQTPITKDNNYNINFKCWILWYIFRPLQGGILSVVVFCLFKQGMLNLKFNDDNSFYFQIGLGFLIGFGSHEVMQKIEEIIKVLFAKNTTYKSTSLDKVNNNKF